MHTVIPSYHINRKTVALIPGMSTDYDTVVIKENGTKYVSQTALQMIHDTCQRDDWTTYEGRRQSVVDQTNFVKKTPIPASIRNGIYLFPTHSPTHMDNHWIASRHVLSMRKAPRKHHSKQPQSVIVFKNGQTLTINVSLHTLHKQMQRTFECMFRIEGMQKD